MHTVSVGDKLRDGAIVLGVRTHASGELRVLAFLADNRVTPFATWIANPPDASNTSGGNYHKDIRDAVQDFETR